MNKLLLKIFLLRWLTNWCLLMDALNGIFSLGFVRTTFGLKMAKETAYMNYQLKYDQQIGQEE